VRQARQNIEIASQSGAFRQWDQAWAKFVAHHVGTWMHVSHGLGLYLFFNASRRAPTNMHNNAISVNCIHRIRFAEDLALHNNLTLSEEIDEFDGMAHLQAWNEDPVWQGVRETTERLTAIDDWCEAVFAANVIFEPLIGELFRNGLVQQAAAHHGDFVTPTVVAAESYDFAERDLRYTTAMFNLLTRDREFAGYNKMIMRGWLLSWVPHAMTAARTLQPLWHQPDVRLPRFEDGLDAAKRRFREIITNLDLEAPKELAQ
jgi:propane 2-monooxygenase small subunit